MKANVETSLVFRALRGEEHVRSRANTGITTDSTPPPALRPVFIGVGGMHLLPHRILAEAGVDVRTGVRVANVQRLGSGRMVLSGTSGEAAYHDSPESQGEAGGVLLGEYDAVLFTDISSSFEEWHRASAGVPEEVAACVRHRVRVPLFSCMIALEHPIADAVALDGFKAAGSSALWWASCSQSKPGFPAGLRVACSDAAHTTAHAQPMRPRPSQGPPNVGR